MTPIRIALAFAIALVPLFAAFQSVALAQEAPDALVKRVSEEALNIIRTDPQVKAGDKSHIRELIEAKIAPHFDMQRMTALAVGRGWRQATPEQKTRLADEFESLLIRTYSNALDQYRDQQLDYKPLRVQPDSNEVTVRTEVVRPGQQPVSIDYSMEKTPAGWKAYDVIVGGVSLVTNYRDEFAQQVSQGGIDSLIKALAAKNAAPTQ